MVSSVTSWRNLLISISSGEEVAEVSAALMYQWAWMLCISLFGTRYWNTVCHALREKLITALRCLYSVLLQWGLPDFLPYGWSAPLDSYGQEGLHYGKFGLVFIIFISTNFLSCTEFGYLDLVTHLIQTSGRTLTSPNHNTQCNLLDKESGKYCYVYS